MSDDQLNEKAQVGYNAAPTYQSPYAALADELYRERVLEARKMSAEEKFLAGEELFEWACSVTLAGIQNENPGMSEEERLQVLEARLAMREKRERES
jgi:hypothetical protein